MDPREIATLIPRALIRLYQMLRVGGHCRFVPSCSDYALEALEAKGLLKGLGLALVRILKCHPWHPGGVDPVTR